jgi:sarcosine oxidase
MQTYDVIVLGLGGMGSATAYECARRGQRVLGIEQFPLVHQRGSSHGQTRVIRQAYYEHPDYVPLLRRSYERWYELEQQAGIPLYTQCGVLSLSPPGGEVVAGVTQAARQHDLAIEPLSISQIRSRFPEFVLPDDYEGVLESQAGYLFVEDCVRACLQLARQQGAALHSEERVISWDDTGRHIEVVTETDRYVADRLIITAGPWAGQVLSQLGLPLRVLRKSLLWFGLSEPSRFRRDQFPIYMVETSGGFYYGFPVIDGRGHKVARHDGGMPVADPLKVERSLLPEDESDCRRFLTAHLPKAAGPLNHHEVCMYTVTPDQHFILDQHPASPRVVLGAGFSGHGFKFASVVGEVLADLSESNRTRWPIERFQLSRFSQFPEQPQS